MYRGVGTRKYTAFLHAYVFTMGTGRERRDDSPEAKTDNNENRQTKVVAGLLRIVPVQGGSIRGGCQSPQTSTCTVLHRACKTTVVVQIVYRGREHCWHAAVGRQPSPPPPVACIPRYMSGYQCGLWCTDYYTGVMWRRRSAMMTHRVSATRVCWFV